jgi:hypothetical protein
LLSIVDLPPEIAASTGYSTGHLKKLPVWPTRGGGRELLSAATKFHRGDPACLAALR